jgi:hypothetical protein
MARKNSYRKLLAHFIIMAVILAPFLDRVGDTNCHPILSQGSPSEDNLANAGRDITFPAINYTVPDDPSSEKNTKQENRHCPFCILNVFGVIGNSQFNISLSSTPFLSQKISLSLLEPTFLITKPPKN